MSRVNISDAAQLDPRLGAAAIALRMDPDALGWRLRNVWSFLTRQGTTSLPAHVLAYGVKRPRSASKVSEALAAAGLAIEGQDDIVDLDPLRPLFGDIEWFQKFVDAAPDGGQSRAATATRGASGRFQDRDLRPEILAVLADGACWSRRELARKLRAGRTRVAQAVADLLDASQVQVDDRGRISLAYADAGDSVPGVPDVVDDDAIEGHSSVDSDDSQGGSTAPPQSRPHGTSRSSAPTPALTLARRANTHPAGARAIWDYGSAVEPPIEHTHGTVEPPHGATVEPALRATEPPVEPPLAAKGKDPAESQTSGTSATPTAPATGTSLGARLCNQLKEFDVTLAEAATALGVEHEDLAALENGHREPTEAESLSLTRLVQRAAGKAPATLDEEIPVLRRERYAVAKLLWQYQESVRKRVMPGCRPLRLQPHPGGPLDAIELRLAAYSPSEAKHALDMAGVEAECLRQAGDDPLKYLNGRTTWKPEQFERLVQTTADQIRSRASARAKPQAANQRQPEPPQQQFKLIKGLS